MSSRVLRGADAAGAEPMRWRQVPGARAPDGAFLADVGGVLGRGPAAGHWPGGDAPAAELDRELERRVAAAREQGLREGEALADARARARMDPLLARLAAAIDDLAAGREGARREAEADIVTLSLAVARRILRRELSVDPTAVLGIVKAAIAQVDAREAHRLLVHPEDEAAVSQAVAALHSPRRIEVAGDSSLERGAVILETTRGTLDASIETQLEEIERGFADLFARRK